MNVIYLKPSGRPYYVSLFAAFLALSALLYLVAPLVPQVNVYALMFGLLVLYFAASGVVFLYFQQVYMHVEDETITVKRGIVTSNVSVIPFNKITEVSTRYTLADKLLGLGSVTLEMMGPEEDDVTFKNVPKESITSFLALFKRSREIRSHEAQPVPGQPEKPEGDRW
ncbi:Bacterial PH domain protein [uncultured archaeon]|nr:Bacterial PH domain protein [uncultured archaeon]